MYGVLGSTPTGWMHLVPANGGCVQEVGRHDNKEVDVVMT
jgi:hypothetical protein